jgi:hypothetical protein
VAAEERTGHTGSGSASGAGAVSGFAALAALAVVLVTGVRWKVPNVPGDVAAERVPLRRVASLPGIPTVLVVTMLLLLGHQATYTYMAPFAERAGFGHTSLVLFVFGIATVAGIWIVGTLIDRHLRPALLGALTLRAATPQHRPPHPPPPRRALPGTTILIVGRRIDRRNRWNPE